VIEHAAIKGRARPLIQNAAGRMRKRCGIDLAPLPGFNGSGDDYPRDGNHETAKDAPEHEASPPGTQLVRCVSK
jgi:hypothetical protein